MKHQNRQLTVALVRPVPSRRLDSISYLAVRCSFGLFSKSWEDKTLLCLLAHADVAVAQHFTESMAKPATKLKLLHTGQAWMLSCRPTGDLGIIMRFLSL